MSAAHTPGPWRAIPERLTVEGYHVAGRAPDVVDAHDRLIAKAVRITLDARIKHQRDDIAEANGRLIAAAPALKAAGILALEAIDNILGAHEGQAEWAQLKAAFDALEAAIAKAESRQ